MERVAIFGGTFSPVHKEHIAVAKQAVKELNLDRLIVMPTFLPPHKSAPTESGQDRINMLKLAFLGEDKIEVSDFELQKKGTSYTYQTVEHFSNLIDGKLYFIVGGDMLENFKHWKNPERILSACTLACFDREYSDVDFEKEREYFVKTWQKDFVKLSYVGKNMSSTKIRVYNRFGLDITDMTDQKVCEYIKANNLYQGDEYSEFVKKSLTIKRLIHTAEVVLCALKKVKELGLDEQKVVTAATLHDCAKYIDYKTVDGFIKDDDLPEPVIHAFLGAFIAQNILKIKDQDIINAIRYHTSGRVGMSVLEKLIFVADMLEDGRTYEGVDTLRQFYQGDLDVCFRECLKEEMIHLINKKQYIYRLTLDAFDYYVTKGEK
ncbi:MAG: nicotinate (nicotinamide) nucleotide adenylyltransferase [Clostridia bacterium]|nr:nicotinate (nicotinamide) nucleotide adenylyltransferase [Clostridia bacterium]